MRSPLTQLARRALLLMFCVFPELHSQPFYGSVVGTITDQSGAAVPGAKVTLTNTGANEERTALTSNLGKSQFLNRRPAT